MDKVKNTWPVAASHTLASASFPSCGSQMNPRPLTTVQSGWAGTCAGRVNARITRMKANTKSTGMAIFASRSMPWLMPLYITYMFRAMVSRKNT